VEVDVATMFETVRVMVWVEVEVTDLSCGL
jgi:hypothetical protein